MIKPGIYNVLSSEDYHSDKNSISRTGIMEFKKSPRKYWANYLNPDRAPKVVKPSWEFGTAFHTMILEPNLFEDHYFIMPEKVLKKENEELFNAHKEAEKEAEKTAKIILSYSDYKKLCDMRDSLLANPRARKLIEGAIYESSYFWEDQDTGLMLKSRPDILHSNLYVDLKTIDDASVHSYQKEMALYGYHIQAAMVEDAVEILESRKLDACINICIEKKYPHCVANYIIDPEAIESGRREYKQTLVDLKSAIEYNSFNDYEVQTVGLPKWYTKL